MSEIKLKSIIIRRFIAYSLDSAIIGILFQVILLSGILSINDSNGSDSKIGFSIVYFIGILLSFGYYILFWTSSAKSTIGQFICKLQIKQHVTAKTCIKRLIYLHLTSLFYWVALSYMNLRGLTGEAANSYILLTAILVITLQIIYAFNVNRIDRASGIEVIEKQ
jgi:RDD family